MDVQVERIFGASLIKRATSAFPICAAFVVFDDAQSLPNLDYPFILLIKTELCENI